MARFPVFLDLHQNNCMVIGGGEYAAAAVELLLSFGAKVTVVSPALCDKLRALDESGEIRYIPRRYFRGDCVNAYIAVAATNVKTVNVSVAEECKARRIPVNVASPAAYGTFFLPKAIVCDDVTVAVSVDAEDGKEREETLIAKLKTSLTKMLAKMK